MDRSRAGAAAATAAPTTLKPFKFKRSVPQI
nr:MAG TPA: hypothetical protein [Caudoviricetes sp.]